YFDFLPQIKIRSPNAAYQQSEFLASDGKSEGQEDFALYFCFDKDESTAMVVPLRAFQTQSRRKYSVKDLVNSAFHCFVLFQATKVPPQRSGRM
ncbi:MAG: hypothetical protein Q4D20_10750, partial [Clostridia bacterium]|nr:hypothetical protein [Clostridia bacterium]